MGNCNCIDERADKDVRVDSFAPSTVKLKVSSQQPADNASAASFELIAPHAEFDAKPETSKPAQAPATTRTEVVSSFEYEDVRPTAEPKKVQSSQEPVQPPAQTWSAPQQMDPPATFGSDGAVTFKPSRAVPTDQIRFLQGAIRIALANKEIRNEERKMVDIPDPPNARDENGTEIHGDIVLHLTPEAKRTLQSLPPFRFTYSYRGVMQQTGRQLRDQSVYLGQWATLSTGGQYRKGKGKLAGSDGSYREGYWIGGDLQSPGRIIYANGDYYEGALKNGARHGSGEFRSYDGRTTYSGSWADDKKHGTGVEKLPDGSLYEGEFIRNNRTGQGKLTLAAGKVYNGQFLDGKFEGYGEHRWPDGRHYEGNWKAGLMHGKGKFTSADRKVYTGDYVNDKKHGHGIFEFDGSVYDGPWVEGKMHGRGYLTTKDKGKRLFEFNDNVRGKEIKE